VKIGLKIFIKLIVFSCLLNTSAINAQILNDTASLSLVKRGVDSLYNFQFNYANDIYRTISQRYPDNPIVVAYKVILIYWENYPLLFGSPEQVSFEAEAKKCIGLCENYNNPSNEAEFLLANLCARGMLMTYYADNDLTMEEFPMLSSTYNYVRHSFDFTSVYPDFYVFTGLYNYYREVYPKVHPSYKILAFLFPRGNRARGLKNLQIATENSILLKAESYSYLSGIYLSYENDYSIALNYSKHLHKLFEANPEYLFGYIRNLLLVKQYDEAERLISSCDTIRYNTFFKAKRAILIGIINEQMYHNDKLAQQYYHKGISELVNYGKYGDEYSAYGYFGLSRISGINGNKEQKKIFRDQALKLATIKRINFDQ
jgi:hypothetical protein